MRPLPTSRRVDDAGNLEPCLEAATCCCAVLDRFDFVQFAAEMAAERVAASPEKGDDAFGRQRRAGPDNEYSHETSDQM